METKNNQRENALSTSAGRLAILILVGIYPMSIVFGAAAVVDFIDGWAFTRTVLASIFMACLLEWSLRLVIREPTMRLLGLGTALLVGGTFSIATNTLRLNGYAVNTQAGWWAAAYVLIATLIGFLVARPWKAGPRDLTALFVVATLMVVANAWRGVSRWIDDPPDRWTGAIESLRNSVLDTQRDMGAPAQDIYFILLDEMGRPDVLKQKYGIDLSPLVDALGSEGFFIPKAGRSNYPYTVLSLSSMLNLSYLDSVADAAGRDNPSRAPLSYLIKRNAMMSLAARAGYEVVAYGADVMPFKRFAEADVCECMQFGPSMFEQATIDKTPLSAVPVGFWTYGAHRARALATLNGLETGLSSTHRQFVYAHILVPHPPFVFNADGSARQPERPFMFNDADDYPGSKTEYISGYAGQAQFVLGRVVSIVKAILERPGPKPVIIIQGDHGPGSEMRLNDASLTNMDERLSAFEAYYMPAGREQLYDTVTPVNAMRIMANHYLGTNLRLKTDDSFFATQLRPFTFIEAFPKTTLDIDRH